MHMIAAPPEELLQSLFDSQISPLSSEPLRITTKESLLLFLELLTPWFKQWGSDGRSRPYSSLLQELENKEVTFSVVEADGTQFILRDIRTATLYVTTSRPHSTERAPNFKKKLWLQEFHVRNGVHVPRTYRNSMSEKLTSDEMDPVLGAIRALEQELSIVPDQQHLERPYLISLADHPTVIEVKADEDPRDPGLVGFEKDVRRTPRYPGLLTRNQLYHFVWHMPEEYFKPEGYKEPGKEHYFYWHEVDAASTE